MTLRKFGDDDTFKLIKELEPHPCLWQKSHHDFKNNFKKIDAFTEIATTLNSTMEVVKEKCRSLRTIYFQNAQKEKKGKSGSGGGAPRRWKFYQALSFLQSEVAESGAIDSLHVDTKVKTISKFLCFISLKTNFGSLYYAAESSKIFFRLILGK